MKAIILAAGRGSRMRELTQDKPKCLVTLGGKSLLEWQISALRKNGVTEIGIVTGYSAESLSSYGDTHFHNADWETTNMVYSLSRASSWLESEPCLVSYSDIVYDASAVERLSRAAAPIAVTYDQEWLSLWSQRFSDPLKDAETFQQKASRLVAIGQRAKSTDEIEGQYMGLLKFTPAGWKTACTQWKTLSSAQQLKCDVTSLLSALVQSGVAVQTVPVKGQWYEVDSESDLKLYENWIETHQSWMKTA